MKTLKPQEGPQEEFLASPADIVIYGGAAGGGKTFGLLLEPLRYMDVPGYNATIFRRNATQISIDGGLLDESLSVYGAVRGAAFKASPHPHWTFNGRGRVSFMHIDGDRDLPKWQGSQLCMIGYDELTHFSENQFFYMLSRNRSTCGVKPYIRCTCNPDVDSWVAGFISWWINPDTGYPIEERSGKIRYFIRVDGEIHWGDTAEELAEKYNVEPYMAKSVTFISSSVYDNKALLDSNPEYLASLNALAFVEKERLLNGNWKIRPAAGLYFRSDQTRIVKEIPDKIVSICRAWDLAATEITNTNKNPDRTAGVLMGRMRNGQYIVLDVIRRADNASTVRDVIRNTAIADKAQYKCNRVAIPQDPGQAGKEQAQSYVKWLNGFSVTLRAPSSDKVTRAEPCAAQWQRGNILLLEGRWNDVYLNELEGFPDALHDDMVDATSDAFAMVSTGGYSAIPSDAAMAHNSYWR